MFLMLSLTLKDTLHMKLIWTFYCEQLIQYKKIKIM